MKIKFNNIRDLNDARYASAKMAEWIGFSVGAADSLSAAKIQEIVGWCAGPAVVIELMDEISVESILSFLDVIEAHFIEVSERDYHRLVDNPGLQHIEWIVKTSSEIAFPVKGWRHKTLKRISGAEPNTIYNIDKVSIEDIKEHLPELSAISLSCIDPAANREKNYSHWNDLFDFFEEL